MNSSVVYALITLVGVVITAVFGLAGYIVREWISGRLVPAAQLEAIREDRDAAVKRSGEETDRWRDAYKFSEQARGIDAGHVGQLLEGVRTTSQVLTALPGTTSQASGETNASVAA
jgi:hypothetical protein